VLPRTGRRCPAIAAIGTDVTGVVAGDSPSIHDAKLYDIA
jgi:hypothetical protein